jgi:hypothetical protein
MSVKNSMNYLEMKRNIEQEQEAAIRGLIGPAIVARHAFIEARLTRGANHILELIEQQQFSEALHLMEQPSWGEDGAAQPAPPDKTTAPGSSIISSAYEQDKTSKTDDSET